MFTLGVYVVLIVSRLTKTPDSVSDDCYVERITLFNLLLTQVWFQTPPESDIKNKTTMYFYLIQPEQYEASTLFITIRPQRK